MEDNYNLENLKKPKKINSRRKGNKFENDIAKLLNKTFDTDDFMRTPGSGAFATTHKLPKHLIIHGDLITPLKFKFIIECKKGYNNLNLYDLLNYTSQLHNFSGQNQKSCKEVGKASLVILKQDRKKELALVSYLNDHESLVSLLQEQSIPYLITKETSVMLYLKDLLALPRAFFFEY